MTGKNKCKILKQIRRQIAAENDIEFVTADCKFQGNCTGTCPKCESEVRYLEDELRKRRQAGKAIAVAGIAAALVATASGCIPAQTGGDPQPGTTLNTTTPTEATEPLQGDPIDTQPTASTEATEGVDGYMEPPMGDIPEEPTEPTEPVDTRLPPYNSGETMGYVR